MRIRSLTPDDLDWAVAALARRRAPLVEQAPVFWRPARDARERHRAYLEYLLGQAGAIGYRTDDSVLLAARRGDGWLIDDAYVPGEAWEGDGDRLWQAFADGHGGAPVRFVCPTFERDRAAFARGIGLALAESWWLLELDGHGGGESGLEIPLPGATAYTHAAPPVYAPPGPVLFLPAPVDAARALPTAIQQAPDLGCAAIVVNHRAGDAKLRAQLIAAGLRQHCDYYEGRATIAEAA